MQRQSMLAVFLVCLQSETRNYVSFFIAWNLKLKIQQFIDN